MPGKIMVSADIYLDGVRLENAVTFIHIKGYGRARVTHVDIEDKKFNKILPPRHSDYPEVVWNSDTVKIPVKGHELVIISKTLGAIINLDGKLYVRGKGKGIFFGFHKEQIQKIEAYATGLGIPPKKHKKI
jgi:hypothetical protein